MTIARHPAAAPAATPRSTSTAATPAGSHSRAASTTAAPVARQLVASHTAPSPSPSPHGPTGTAHHPDAAVAAYGATQRHAARAKTGDSPVTIVREKLKELFEMLGDLAKRTQNNANGGDEGDQPL